MELISCPKATQRFKRDNPFFGGLIAVSLGFFGICRWWLGDDLMMYLLTSFLLAAAPLFAGVMHRQVLDEAYDLGNCLLLRRRDREVTIALGEIARVKGERGRGALIVTLTFQSPTALGQKAIFYRKGLWNARYQDVWVEELKARIEVLQARQCS